MRIAVESGAGTKDQVFAAQAVAKWARTLPLMFPPGSNVPPTRAKPEVWTDRAGFEAKAADYAAAADKLAEIADSGDSAAFLAQLSATRDKCKACHQVYHLPAPTSDGKQ
jgi:cytochrome c556